MKKIISGLVIGGIIGVSFTVIEMYLNIIFNKKLCKEIEKTVKDLRKQIEGRKKENKNV